MRGNIQTYADYQKMKSNDYKNKKWNASSTRPTERSGTEYIMKDLVIDSSRVSANVNVNGKTGEFHKRETQSVKVFFVSGKIWSESVTYFL